MTTRAEFLRMRGAHPEWGPEQLAKALGCHSSYVRSTARRLKITLPSSLKTKQVRMLGEAAFDAGMTLEIIRKLVAAGVIENLKVNR